MICFPDNKRMICYSKQENITGRTLRAKGGGGGSGGGGRGGNFLSVDG